MAKNDASLSKGKPAGGMTPENTNAHKLRAMGKSSKLDEHSGKKTPA